MTTEDRLLANYGRVQEKLDAACARYGRNPRDVLLIAVSKLHAPADMAVIARAGQIDFGENYVQEALAKMDLFKSGYPELRWHMIGHVQSRKAAKIAGKFTLVHTIDSLGLADAFQRRLGADQLIQDCLIEVNIADEPQKSGVATGGLEKLGAHILENCPRLRLRGLMCLPPVFDSGDAARPYFGRLRELRDRLEPQLGVPLPELSMGMSGDFEAAVAEGATIVRIGTDIFGPRPRKV